MDWFYKMEEKNRIILTVLCWIVCLFSSVLETPFLFVITVIPSIIFTFLTAHAHDKDKKAAEKKKAEEERLRQEALRHLTPDDLGIHIQGVNSNKDSAPAPQGSVTQKRVYLNTLQSVTNFLASNSYIVIDLETSGLSKYENEIIEIAMIKIQNGQEIGRFQTLVKPYEEITKKITQITGITNDMLEDAPYFPDIADSVASFIGDNVLVAHNSSFDIGFLAEALEPRALHLKHIDTLHMARTACPDLPNHKLETLIEHYGVANRQTHRAMGDAECTQKIFVRLCADIIANSSVSK